MDKFEIIRKSLFNILTVVITLSCSADSRQSYREWQVYSGDYAGTKYSELDQVNSENVTQLEVAWIFRTGPILGGAKSTIECNPIIVDGVMYLTSPSLKIFALNAETGQEIWQLDPFIGGKTSGVNRGVTYWEDGDDKRILYVAGPHLYALNAATGEPIKSFGTDGKVDIREELDRDVFPLLTVSATTPGVIYKDLLILGSIVDDGPSHGAPGHVRAFNVRTGKREWIFHTIPYPGEPGHETWPRDAWKKIGGTNAWGGFTLDEERGMVFFGTGSPSYDAYGGDREGKTLYGNCIMALKADTGEMVWYFQTVHHDLWDYDIPCPPNLVTIEHNGKMIDAIAQPTKMGHLFVLDRDTGKPIFPVEERPVKQSEIPGEHTWPTQPFPVKPPAYAKQGFTEEDITNLSPEAHAAIYKDFVKWGPNSLFDPASFEGTIVMPQFNGGTDWGGAAFDPESGILYVNASDEAEWTWMTKSVPSDQITLNRFGRNLYRAICSVCHGSGRANLPGAPSFPSLLDVKERRTKEEVRDILENGKGQMPSFAIMSDIEKRAITAYLFDEGKDEKVANLGELVSWAKDIPYVGTGHNEFRDPEGYPANKPPWGRLSAIDLNKGEILWQVPLGTYPELEAKGHPPTGTFNMGGPVVTSGGLVFIGGAMDERFHAYDKKTGKLLWEFQMDAGGYATPATYEINGRQYIVIAAGGGGKPGTKSGNAYYAFALPRR